MTRRIVILGTSVTVPDTAVVTALAASFRNVNGSMGELEGTLRTLTRPDAWGEWTGLAADAFGQSIGRLPAEAEDIRHAYGAVAAALQNYAGQLEPVIAALTSLFYRAEEAEGTLTATRHARDQVIAQGHNPLSTGWDTRLEEAGAAVAALRRQLSRLVSELDALASTCAREIAAAEPKPQKKSLFSELTSDFMKDVADPLARAAAVVARAERQVADAVLSAGIVLAKDDLKLDEFEAAAATEVLEALFIHPFTDLWHDHGGFSLENVSRVLGDVAAILGIAGMVAMLFVPGADLVVTGLLAASLAANIDAAAADWVAVAHHDPDTSVQDAILATASLALAAVSMGAGAKADVLLNGDDARASGDALRTTGISRSFTLTDIKATFLSGASALEKTVADNVRSQVNEFIRFGEDGPPRSPAAVKFQHVKWTADRANDVLTVVQDKLSHRHPAESKSHDGAGS